jgi:hypothetical protein
VPKYHDRGAWKKRQWGYRPRRPFAIVEGAGTPPFNRLSPEAAWVLLKLYGKFNGKNRSDLSLTYRETKETMCSKVRNRATWQLLGYGFVDVKRWGRLERNCTIFALSDRWRRLCAPEAEPQLDKIEAILKEIQILQREKCEGGNKSEKRQRIAALRKEVFDA